MHDIRRRIFVSEMKKRKKKKGVRQGEKRKIYKETSTFENDLINRLVVLVFFFVIIAENNVSSVKDRKYIYKQ